MAELTTVEDANKFLNEDSDNPFYPGLDLLNDAGEKVTDLVKNAFMMPVRGGETVLKGAGKAIELTNKSASVGAALGVLDPRKYGVPLPDPVDKVLDATYADIRDKGVDLARQKFGEPGGIIAEVVLPDFIDLLTLPAAGGTYTAKIGKLRKVLTQFGAEADNILNGIVRALQPEMVVAGIPGATSKNIDKIIGDISSTPLKITAGEANLGRRILTSPKASGSEYQTLKGTIGDWITENKEGLLSGEVKRSSIGKIIVDGRERRIQGIHAYLNDGTPFKLTPLDTRQLHAVKRVRNTSPPIQSLVEFAEEHRIPIEYVDTFIKEARDGFRRVKEAARRKGLTYKQLQTEYRTGKKTSITERYGQPRHHAGHMTAAAEGGPTTGDAAFVQPELENIRNLNKPEGNINIYAADLAGVPTTWEEALLLSYARSQNIKVPGFFTDFDIDEQQRILDIPWNASKDEVNAVFKDIFKSRKSNPNHFIHVNQTEILEDIKLDERYTEVIDEVMSKEEATQFFKNKGDSLEWLKRIEY